MHVASLSAFGTRLVDKAVDNTEPSALILRLAFKASSGALTEVTSLTDEG